MLREGSSELTCRPRQVDRDIECTAVRHDEIHIPIPVDIPDVTETRPTGQGKMVGEEKASSAVLQYKRHRTTFAGHDEVQEPIAVDVSGRCHGIRTLKNPDELRITGLGSHLDLFANPDVVVAILVPVSRNDENGMCACTE